MIKLYENIKTYREARGMSQETLAKMTGYTDRSSIAKIEKGLVDLQQSKILAFAAALDVPVITLVGWEDESMELTDSERHLVGNYRQLDPYDRGKVDGYVESLIAEKYEKNQEGMESLCG